MSRKPGLRAIFGVLLLAATASSASLGAQEVGGESAGFAMLKDCFEYDRGVPLEARVVAQQEGEDFRREKLVFTGGRDRRVTGYLALPNGAAGPAPCVLLIHGLGASKEAWWPERAFNGSDAVTEGLLSAGFAVLSLDCVYHGERAVDNDYESASVFVFEKAWTYRARDMIVDSVVEHRRAIDYFESRAEIDAERVGVIGYSMGGMMAFQLAAVDPRIRCAVSCVSPILPERPSAIAVQNFAPHVRERPFLMMVGRHDRLNYSVEAAQALFEQIGSEDKDLVLFDSGHLLPEEWSERAVSWSTDWLE